MYDECAPKDKSGYELDVKSPPKCANCRFYRKEGDYKAGACRRRAPIRLNTSNVFGHFPIVYEHDWCGEYEAID